jgi:hypothetical protein
MALGSTQPLTEICTFPPSCADFFEVWDPQPSATFLAWIGLNKDFFAFQCKRVKFNLVQALRLCTGHTARRGSRGLALPFFDHGTRRGWMVSVTPPGRSLPPRKTRYPLYIGLGGPQGRSGQVRKISPPTGIRSPDGPARRQSLYRLSYLDHLHFNTIFIKSPRSFYGKCWKIVVPNVYLFSLLLKEDQPLIFMT